MKHRTSIKSKPIKYRDRINDYTMYEVSAEVDDGDFPELEGQPAQVKDAVLRFLSFKSAAASALIDGVLQESDIVADVRRARAAAERKLPEDLFYLLDLL